MKYLIPVCLLFAGNVCADVICDIDNQTLAFTNQHIELQLISVFIPSDREVGEALGRKSYLARELARCTNEDQRAALDTSNWGCDLMLGGPITSESAVVIDWIGSAGWRVEVKRISNAHSVDVLQWRSNLLWWCRASGDIKLSDESLLDVLPELSVLPEFVLSRIMHMNGKKCVVSKTGDVSIIEAWIYGDQVKYRIDWDESHRNVVSIIKTEGSSTKTLLMTGPHTTVKIVEDGHLSSVHTATVLRREPLRAADRERADTPLLLPQGARISISTKNVNIESIKAEELNGINN